MAPKRYYATIPFGYGDDQLDREQVTELREDAPNNEKLIRLGYFKLYEGKVHELIECPECGAKFRSQNGKIGHYKRKHVPLTEQEADQLDDNEQRIIAQLNPLQVPVGA